MQGIAQETGSLVTGISRPCEVSSILPLPFVEIVLQLGKNVVIPAEAGIQELDLLMFITEWMPVFAGIANYDTVSGWERAG
jgi:hypothetical protein